MSNLREFKQKLAMVSRWWEARDFDRALAEVESLRESWPGNAHLHILWASLVQLQEDPQHDLEAVRQALQQAVELDKGSPAGALELGYFLDNVEDDPQAASKAYAEGILAARKLLMEGLIGQAKAFLQLEKRDEFFRCLLEVLHLVRFDASSKRHKADESGVDILLETLASHFDAISSKGPYTDQIQELLNEASAHRPA
jgi:hypothetical protein